MYKELHELLTEVISSKQEHTIKKYGITLLLQNPELTTLPQKTKAKLIKLRDFIRMYNATEFLHETVKLDSSKKAGDFLKKYYENITDREIFSVIFLNAQNELIKHEKMFDGTLTETAVYSRVLIHKALNYNANTIIISHNHPAGSLVMSNADKRVTENLVKACKAVEIKLLDHIICTPNRDYISMAEEGYVDHS